MRLPRTYVRTRAVLGRTRTTIGRARTTIGRAGTTVCRAGDTVRSSGDRGDVIGGWLVKLTLILAILGVIAFDGLAVGTTKMSAKDNASDAALAASDSWNAQHSGPLAYAAAEQNAQQNDARVVESRFRIDPDGTVHVAVRKTAHTIVLKHIGFLHSWTVQQSAATARDMS